MKKSKLTKALFLAAALTLSTNVYSAMAASVTPTEIEGNKPSVDSTYSTLKIDPVTSGTYTDGKLTITLTVSEDNRAIDWTSNIPVQYVFVKGGPGGYLYHYSSSKGDTVLIAPDNHGGQQPEISHVSFYYDPTPKPPCGCPK